MRIKPTLVLSIVALAVAVVGCHKRPRKGANSPKGGAQGVTVVASSTGAEPATAPTTAGPPPSMSESERKATARAAFQEGVTLQENGKCPEALPKFEVAQKFFPAPTHMLHLAQCSAATGKLVEASEIYETLARSPVTKESPDAFKHAVDEAKKEGPSLRARLPTLRITVTPQPAGLSVRLNNVGFPTEVLGIARPVNPGHYKVVVSASGYREATSEVDVAESSARSVDLKLSK